MLTEFNEGGSHESNPNGGILQGQSSNGQMNTVEQGETKKGNFVYSDRLYINEDLVKAMNLPGYIKGKSFASASKAINDKFKDRNDIHTKATQKELLDRLAQSQEQLKAEQEAINQSMQINQSELDYPEETQQFKTGGPMGILGGGENGILGGTSFEQDSPENSMDRYNGSVVQSDPSQFSQFMKQNGSGIGDVANMIGNSMYAQDSKKAANLGNINKVAGAIGGPVGQYAKVATGAYDAGSEIFGKSDVDTSGNTVLQSVDTGKAAAKGALNGAAAGMAFGPLGAGVGAAIGGVAGLVGGNKDKKAVAKNNEIFFRKDNFYKYQFNENNNDTKVYALGGEIDPPIKKSITVDNTQNIQNKINEVSGVTDPNSKIGHSRLMGEIKLINKRNDGYGILYDTDEGEKYEVVKSNAFTGMQNLPELKRYKYKRGEYSDPNFLEDGRNVEALKKGWQSSGYNPNLVTYPQSVEAYRAAIGQPAFYTPEQLATMSKQFKKGGFLDGKNPPDTFPNGIYSYNNANDNLLFKKPSIPMADFNRPDIPTLYGNYNQFNEPINAKEYLLKNKGNYDKSVIKNIQSQIGAFVDGIPGKETYVKSGLRHDGSEYPIELNADKALEIALETPDSEVKPDYTLDDIKNMEADYNKNNQPTIGKDDKKIDYSKYKNAATNALRYAPILGNILQKNKIGPAEVDSAIRNPYQYKKQYIDEAQYRNAADQQAALSMEALNKSGLSGNQLMAASLGSQLARTKGVAEGAMAAKMHNLNENKIAEQVKQQNEGDFIIDSRYVRGTNAQNRANRDTQISKFDSEIYNSLGEIGKEETFKKMAEKMTGYDWLGKYLKANPNATPSEAIAAYDKEQEDKGKESKKYFENLPEFSDKIDYKTPGIVQNKKGGMMNLKFNKY